MSVLPFFQCLERYDLSLFLTERQRLGGELLHACRKHDWQKAISFVEKGEWSRAERHSEVMFCYIVAQQPDVSAHVSYVATSSHSYVAS